MFYETPEINKLSCLLNKKFPVALNLSVRFWQMTAGLSEVKTCGVCALAGTTTEFPLRQFKFPVLQDGLAKGGLKQQKICMAFN